MPGQPTMPGTGGSRTMPGTGGPQRMPGTGGPQRMPGTESMPGRDDPRRIMPGTGITRPGRMPEITRPESMTGRDDPRRIMPGTGITRPGRMPEMTRPESMPGREYGIKGSFDKDYLEELLAGTRSRVDDILDQSDNESRRDAIIRKNQESIQSDLEYLNETIGDPIDREAERDLANPRFDPYDVERRQRLLNDYEQMAQQNRDAYDQQTAGIGQSSGKQSLVQLAGRYGAGPKFGHKPYQQARELGYSDSEILSFLDENPGYQSPDLYNELKSGNVDMDNIVSDADRGRYDFRNIIGMM